MVLGYFCFFAVVISARSASAPFIKPCKPGDNACLLSSAQAAIPFVAPGIPELGMKSLDPLVLKLVTGDNAGLKLTMKDTIVTGMKNCIVEGVKFEHSSDEATEPSGHDLSKGKQSLTIRCTVNLKGDYNLDGRIIILPVQGDGRHDIDIRDIVIKAVTDLGTVKGADGKEHWHIKSWKHTYQTKGGAHFNFMNLFNGNKILAGPVLEFVNSNWGDVMKEIAPPIVYAIVEAVVNSVEALYKAVPAEELAIN